MFQIVWPFPSTSPTARCCASPRWLLRAWSGLLTTRVNMAASAALAVLGLVHLIVYYGECDYPQIPREQIAQHLYLQVNANLLNTTRLPACSYQQVLNNRSSIKSWEISRSLSFDPVAAGVVNGSWSPSECTPRVSVALLVPYRDRQTHLAVFLPYMHQFLRRQHVHYQVYVIEQQDDAPWNKGLLYNTGARVAAADGWPCLILHDVDLLPLDAGNLYSCLQAPRHMSGAVDSLRLALPYRALVGGVLAVRADHYKRVHGLSERYLGWGGEDDDFHMRLTRHGLEVLRLEWEVSRYTMLAHAQSPRNPRRFALLAEGAQHAAGAAAAGDTGARPRYVVRARHMYMHVLVNTTVDIQPTPAHAGS